MIGTFLAGPVGSWLRVFLGTALTVWLADLTTDKWAANISAYALAGVVAVLPLVIAFLNPADVRFGRGAPE